MTIRIRPVEQIVHLSWPHSRGTAETEVRVSTFSGALGVLIKAQPEQLIAKTYSWQEFSQKAALRDPDADPARQIALDIIEYATTGQNPDARRWNGQLTHGSVEGSGAMDLADTIRALVKATDEGQQTRE